MIKIPYDYIESERGNTLLESDGKFVAWIEIAGTKKCFEIEYTPQNYPSLYVRVTDYDTKKIRDHVINNLQGWFVGRWNIDGAPPVDEHNMVTE